MLILAVLLGLAAQRPFDHGAIAADMAIENHLPRLLGAAGAYINALGDAQHRTLHPEAPTRAAREAEEHGVAILGERRLHGRMQVEADRKALAGAAGEAILAAQILAVGAEEQLPRVRKAEIFL